MRRCKKSTILAVAPFPPPVHGASRVSRAVIDSVLADCPSNLYVNEVNTGARWYSGKRAAAYHAERILRNLLGLAALLSARLRGNVVAYIGGAGGIGLWYQVATILLAKVLGAGVVFHHHSSNYLSKSPMLSMRMICRLMSTLDVHIFLSELMRRQFGRLYASSSRTVVCSNVAFVSLKSGANEQSRNGYRLIHISNLSQKRERWRLFRSSRSLRSRSVDVDLTLIGPATREVSEEIDRVVAEFREVRYLGSQGVETITSELDRADLFLFPTRYVHEAEPLVVLEALGRGVPVLASRRGSLPAILPSDWLVDDWGSAGMLVQSMMASPAGDQSARAAGVAEHLLSGSTDPKVAIFDRLKSLEPT